MDGFNLLILPGDGIGPEVMLEAERVLKAIITKTAIQIEFEHQVFGGASIDKNGTPATEEVLRKAKEADAVLLGAVGGPKWDNVAPEQRPEKGLLALRQTMGVFANLRPAKLFSALRNASPLKETVARDFDFVVVRELIGDVYFGNPRGIQKEESHRLGINTMRYSEPEVERIARVAFDIAGQRQKRVCSVDKANVLEVSRVWRDVVQYVAKDFPEIELSHMYVDNCAMQLVLNPSQFDVIVTGNLFGDILSDEAGAITGSIGLLPSASLGKGSALYEPIHGSAPDIAGQGKANPLAAILSVAMLFEYSLGRKDLSQKIQQAVDRVLSSGLRTADLARGMDEPSVKVVSTSAMTDAVIERLAS